MLKAEFTFKSNIWFVMCNENDKFEDICKSFAIKAEANLNYLVFLYRGMDINLGQTVSSIISKFDKERKIISILVDDLSPQNQKKTNIIKSTIPICPICYENVKFDIINYIISLSGCKNNHLNNMFIKEYEQTQNIDLNKIVCTKCNAKKLDTYENMMYYCNKCKMILCPLCKSQHDKLNKAHNAINYDYKNYTCEKHNELYNSYCKSCKINICVKCQKDHLQHDIISFGTIFPDIDELLNSLKDFRKIIDVFNNSINSIIDRFNKVKENIEMIYKIYYEIVANYEDKNRNYEIFMSLNDIKNNNVMKELQKINQINNINEKAKEILNIYEQMNQSNQTNANNIQNNVPRANPNQSVTRQIIHQNSQNTNSYYHSEMLKHLLRSVYFKKELKN